MKKLTLSCSVVLCCACILYHHSNVMADQYLGGIEKDAVYCKGGKYHVILQTPEDGNSEGMTHYHECCDTDKQKSAQNQTYEGGAVTCSTTSFQNVGGIMKCGYQGKKWIPYACRVVYSKKQPST